MNIVGTPHDQGISPARTIYVSSSDNFNFGAGVTFGYGFTLGYSGAPHTIGLDVFCRGEWRGKVVDLEISRSGLG